jgi:hypothetical protein
MKTVFKMYFGLSVVCLSVASCKPAQRGLGKFNCVSAAHYREAEAALHEARMQIERHQFERASRVLKVALTDLEYRYMPNGHDDTGLTLYVADSEEHLGHWSAAANYRWEVLRERLSVSQTPGSSKCLLPRKTVS